MLANNQDPESQSLSKCEHRKTSLSLVLNNHSAARNCVYFERLVLPIQYVASLCGSLRCVQHKHTEWHKSPVIDSYHIAVMDRLHIWHAMDVCQSYILVRHWLVDGESCDRLSARTFIKVDGRGLAPPPIAAHITSNLWFDWKAAKLFHLWVIHKRSRVNLCVCGWSLYGWVKAVQLSSVAHSSLWQRVVQIVCSTATAHTRIVLLHTTTDGPGASQFANAHTIAHIYWDSQTGQYHTALSCCLHLQDFRPQPLNTFIRNTYNPCQPRYVHITYWCHKLKGHKAELQCFSYHMLQY